MTTIVRRCALGALFVLVGSAAAQEPASDAITADALIEKLRENASLGQLDTMRAFAGQADAPGALPRLLEILQDEAPQMDNNVCLAVELILMEHPGVACPLEPLIEAVERKIWNSQQKAAQALFHAITPESTEGLEERLARALIPLMTSQRGRVFEAGVRCLEKLSGQEHDPEPEPWSAWFESRFELAIDLGEAVYELIAVVRRTSGEGESSSYSVNGEDVGDGAALEAHLIRLAELAAERGLELGGIVQISDSQMDAIAKTMDLSLVEEQIGVFKRLGISGTVSPESDVFRAPWQPASDD